MPSTECTPCGVPAIVAKYAATSTARCIRNVSALSTQGNILATATWHHLFTITTIHLFAFYADIHAMTFDATALAAVVTLGGFVAVFAKAFPAAKTLSHLHRTASSTTE